MQRDTRADPAPHGSMPFSEPRADHEGIVFLGWAPSSPRAEGISNALGARLFLLSYKFKKKIYSPIKYPLLFWKSISLLSKNKPHTIICQDPSPFCTLAAIAYRFLTRSKPDIIVDAHTAAIQSPWSKMKVLHRWILRRARAVIVTNSGLKNRLTVEYGVDNCIVLPDRIPEMGDGPVHTSIGMRDSQFRVAVISSFAPDEPIQDVINAARIAPDVTFYITGDSSAAPKKIVADGGTLPNVVFTGYLSRSDYVALLSGVNAVVALTKRDDTMLAGAHEALSLAKPLITSTHPALVQYFDMGTIHVSNSSEEIARAVESAKERETLLREEAVELRQRRREEWTRQFDSAKKLLGLGDVQASLDTQAA